MLKFTALPAPLVVDLEKSVSKIVDEPRSFPCRRCLKDGLPGEEMLLVPYDPFPAASPYTGPGPIFVHRKDCVRYQCDGSVPDQQRRRLLSVRAYDANQMMTGCAVVEGKDLAEKAKSFFADAKVDYIHVHNASPGCFAVRVDRA
ncbi:hypothetical protein N7474_008603 [Penicillium riverlandense]|uniref:uncharacterized protein n=1 Tax=Penicillium riverlandense TaxID=1903569 RepID=UPI0025496EC4|nr:uncharacterized protein N7474_008603 [Penicillium riverlandense]KAJ5812302.1 hypothetical protein N7474_008603 [Penicillium riverlandense]